ncbi:CBS domain-containing protein [Nannocystis pusilla]|uniref:CBS domain-containing protein n=2 Tax=Nannocystis pusilla TaxID=889268 RepID=A0A9X3ERZ3_9BACT|nr:CBS domain-containing protein [Nannocystis pusilla]MCY1009244.1 CBS domain-containing protein [Nannocystis pusilla]
MSKHRSIPEVRRFMSTEPHTIGADQTMAAAHETMRKHRIRHLPVLSASRLVGILSDRDLHMVETLRDVDPERVRVEEAMSQEVYAIRPDAPIDEVVKEMARHKYGSAVIVDNDHVVGVFTTVDACRAFSEMLHTHLG